MSAMGAVPPGWDPARVMSSSRRGALALAGVALAFGAWGIAAKRLTSGPAAARRKPRHCPPMPWGARILNMRLRKRDDALMDDGTAELAESVSLSTPGWTPAEPAAQAQMPAEHQAMVRRLVPAASTGSCGFGYRGVRTSSSTWIVRHPRNSRC